MNLIHPNTNNMLLVSEHSPFVAELEIFPKYQSILIGEVGHSHGLTIGYEDWPGFLEFVKEIDRELNELPQHKHQSA